MAVGYKETNILLVAVCSRMSKKMSIPTHTSYKWTLLIYRKHTTKTYTKDLTGTTKFV